MRLNKTIGSGAVRENEQPEGNHSIGGVKTMTHRRLSDLRDESVQVVHDDLLKFAAPLEFLFRDFMPVPVNVINKSQCETVSDTSRPVVITSYFDISK